MGFKYLSVITLSEGSLMSHLEIKTAFKALIRETSVYKYYIELKENSLTSKGYLDIAKIP